jgi:Ca-activated chloride channel homolog
VEDEWCVEYRSIYSRSTGYNTPGPGTIHPSLETYIGETPLYFTIPDNLYADSLLIVKITYVQLLPYEFGNVNYSYPNDYSLIQTTAFDYQQIEFNLISQRTIDSIKMTSHIPQSITNGGHSASLSFSIAEQSANSDYKIVYSLSSGELGLFSMSSFFPDTLLPDSVGRGFFIFIAEPDVNQTTVINKVFTLIIDRSGSMSGNKMEQAKQAAAFIVNHLNEGDKFNLIDFDDIITAFQPQHVPFNPDYKAAALTYISGLYARGMTNISGAFGMAIPQFVNVNDSTANIIIFLTDGEATAGITNTTQILEYVNGLVQQTDTTLTIFNFGIGSYVNEQLLTLLASQNRGICEFLKSDELEERISKFYLKIRNPVLLNTSVAFSPNVLTEVYPNPLPNLYKGQQLIVSGRYQEAPPVTVTLSGTAFGQPVSYQYQMALSDSSAGRYLFLTKIWAKLKIENLLVLYYSLYQGSPQAEAVKEQIIWISINYGVISPFTNLSGGGTTGVEESSEIVNDELVKFDFRLKGNYPNPFNPSTNIVFEVNKDIQDYAVVRIYNMLGELIMEYKVFVSGRGEYKVTWNGLNREGISVSTGNYIYVVSFANTVLSGKMTLLK